MKDLKRLFWSFIIKGIPNMVSEDKFEERIGICRANSCGSYKKPLGIKTLEKCNECGCFLRAKARIDEFYIKCPKDLW